MRLFNSSLFGLALSGLAASWSQSPTILFAQERPLPDDVTIASDFALEKSYYWNEFDYRHSEILDPGGLHVFLNPEMPTTVVVLIRGQIPYDSISHRFREATQNRSTLFVVLDSIGGNSSQAEEIASQIRELQAPRGLPFRKKWANVTTYIPQNSSSHSASTIIFLSAKDRRTHPTSQLSIHASNLVGDTRTSHEERDDWIQLGLPQGLGQKLFEEGHFNERAADRILTPKEIRIFDVARPDELPFIEALIKEFSSNRFGEQNEGCKSLLE